MQVTKLELLNAQLKADCIVERADNAKLKGEFRMALNIVYGYVIDESKPWCAVFARKGARVGRQTDRETAGDCRKYQNTYRIQLG